MEEVEGVRTGRVVPAPCHPANGQCLDETPIKYLSIYSGDPAILVLNAHGNETVFNGYTGQQVWPPRKK